MSARPNPESDGIYVYDLREVLAKTGLTFFEIARGMNDNSFPEPLRESTDAKRVWCAKEIDRWVLKPKNIKTESGASITVNKELSADGKKLLSASQAAKAAEISQSTLGKWIKAGKFPEPDFIGANDRRLWKARTVKSWKESGENGQ